MRILISGGSSFLGQHLVPLASQNHVVCYTFFTHDPLRPRVSAPVESAQIDLRDAGAFLQLTADFKPDVIFHLAGSNRTDDMTAVIVEGARTIRLAAKQSGARIIHMSSDVVFDGQHAPYKEDAPLSPIHEYGRAKAAAEAIITEHSNSVIIRTSLIFGLSQIDRSMQWIIESLKQNESVTLFSDQIRTPIAAETLSAACLELGHQPYTGILHVAGAQAVSRATLGLKLLDWWGVTHRTSLTISPMPPGAPWPHDTRLDITRAAKTLATPLLGLDDVMAASRPLPTA